MLTELVVKVSKCGRSASESSSQVKQTHTRIERDQLVCFSCSGVDSSDSVSVCVSVPDFCVYVCE